LATGRINRNAAGVWRPAAIDLVKVLSQPQVRTHAKPIKEILAAGCVVHWLAIHETKITAWSGQSSRTMAPFAVQQTQLLTRANLQYWIYDLRFPPQFTCPRKSHIENRKY
jgi:hypothetical protein